MPLVVTNSTPTATPTLANPAEGLRDIAPPIEIPSGYEWLWWTLGTIALAVALIWLARWLQRRRQQQLVVPPIPAHIRARQKLEEALAFIAQPKPFCIAVSDALRAYLEERFTFHAPERTTEEFLYELQATTLLTPSQKTSLGDFLTNCDLVKFAKYEPGEPELRGLHDSALRLVDETQLDEVQSTASVAPMVDFAAPQDAPSVPTGERLTFKERLIGFAIAVALILIGVATWLWPYLHLVPQESLQNATLGSGGRRVVGLLRILEFLWSRPLGTLLALVGCGVLWGVFTKKYKDSRTET